MKKNSLQIVAKTTGEIIGACRVGVVKTNNEMIESIIRPLEGQMLHEVEVSDEVINLLWNPEAFYRWCKGHYLTSNGELKSRLGDA